ncbi:MAG TPA: recombination mediator RecR [Lacibacter sp.]|nr:recombination mediator RecR [Lacibacter sp.]HMO88164.1 recombination mediator RecR [Lacibacter sp.]HMP86586.1 recombination mediator RecR [Lacibacter sp.]
MNFSSTLLEQAVQEFAKLPGIGKKTALRLVLHLIRQPAPEVELFTGAVAKLRRDIKFCRKCANVSDTEWCNLCSNPMRNKRLVCVVESIRDVIAIESTQQFSGLYHVLGGVISPLDGIGPDQLSIEALIGRLEQDEVEELIFALSPTIQGDTTLFYISKKIKSRPVRITTIARGIAFGGELEYADELTLARSIQNRQPVDQYISSPKS